MLTQASEFQTPLHQWPVGLKFLLMIIAIILTMMVYSVFGQMAVSVLIAVLYLTLDKRFFLAGLYGLKPLIYFVIFMLIWNAWRGEWMWGLVMALRLMNGFAIANLFTLTTRLGDILSFLREILRPLRRFGVNAEMIALSLALAMRFIPVLREKYFKLHQSWRSRTTRRGNFRLVLPLTLLALDDAEQISEALRARGGILDKDDQHE